MTPNADRFFVGAIAVLSGLLGAVIMVGIAPALDDLMGREFFGNVVGGFIGGAVVLAVLGYETKQRRIEQRENSEKLRRALWVEAQALSRLYHPKPKRGSIS
jgi:membrane associated rhomboid family serine protease